MWQPQGWLQAPDLEVRAVNRARASPDSWQKRAMLVFSVRNVGTAATARLSPCGRLQTSSLLSPGLRGLVIAPFVATRSRRRFLAAGACRCWLLGRGCANPHQGNARWAAMGAKVGENLPKGADRGCRRDLIEAEALSGLPPLASSPAPRNRFLDLAPKGADMRKLAGHAFYYPSLLGHTEDRTVFQRLMEELCFRPCWLDTGMKFNRTICLGSDELLASAPTYRAVIERLSEHFDVRVIRSLANLYRDGKDWCNLHSDQYHQGNYPIDITVGVTFGDTRKLVFVEKAESGNQIEIPQRNGDVFAFSNEVNQTWRHMVPRAPKWIGPRISIIVWCTRQQHQRLAIEKGAAKAGGVATKTGGVEEDRVPTLGSFPHMLHCNPMESRRNGRGGKASTKGASAMRGRQGAHADRDRGNSGAAKSGDDDGPRWRQGACSQNNRSQDGGRAPGGYPAGRGGRGRGRGSSLSGARRP